MVKRLQFYRGKSGNGAWTCRLGYPWGEVIVQRAAELWEAKRVGPLYVRASSLFQEEVPES